ncbi:hypothetical protein B0J14DRAFT_652208 [Halenospora varia]|nr:hypothetical protein B0J14DRAFT_652208 [Halenospora varia]
MARIPTSILPLLLGFTSAALAVSEAANNSATSCSIAGDSDTYGLGVRLGVYLQWVATLVAVTTRLRIASQIRTANTVLQLASLAGIFFLTFKRQQVYAVEPLIVIYFSFGASWLLVFVALEIKGSINEAILRVLVYATMHGYITWYFWHGIDTMLSSPCGTSAFFGNNVDLFGWFRTLGKIFTAVGCPVHAFLLLFHLPSLVWLRYPILKPNLVCLEFESEIEKGDFYDGKEIDFGVLFLWIAYAAFSLLFMIFMIAGAEMMIISNHITSMYRMDSTGQLIPVIMGAALLGTVILETYREAKKSRPISQPTEPTDDNNKRQRLLGTWYFQSKED